MVVSAKGRLWSKLSVVFTMAATSAACAPMVIGDCGVPLAEDTVRHPFVDDWRVEVDAEFPHVVDGEVKISSIGIGGLTTQDNFANRGDVIVKAGGPEGRILVEMRRFTWRETEKDAQLDFETTELLAHTGSLEPPYELSEDNRCALRDPDDPEKLSPWQDACSIRLYYNGQIQPSRLGADFRVTLPASYRGAIFVTTDDNDQKEDYFDRGNVCVEDLFASLDAELESGTAYVLFEREATPLSCDAPDLQDCTDFGSTKVETTGRATVAIDVPQGLWAELCLNSDGDIEVDWPAAEIDPPDESCKMSAEANRPAEYTPGEEGPYTIVVSTGGGDVPEHTDNPGDYPGSTDQPGQGTAVRLCAGCIVPATCDDLLAELESEEP